MRLYHGAHTEYTLHVGQCYTDSETAASRYAGYGEMAEVAISLDGLTVLEIDGYDSDTDVAPGDDGENENGADVIIYDDQDENGREHVTYRLMSPKAIAAVEIIETWEN